MDEKAKKVIEKILYITIASSSNDGNPWNSPVFCAYDKDYNFYWVSAHNSRHSTNIKENNKVALVIYDSTASSGTGFGVYVEAKAYELTEENEIQNALNLAFGRAGSNPPSAKDCMGNSPLRAYKAVSEKFWVNSAEDYNGQYVDNRLEIKLK